MATILQHPHLKKKEVAGLIKNKQPIIIKQLYTGDGNNVVLLSDYQKKEKQLISLKIVSYISMVVAAISSGVCIWLLM